MHMPNTLSVVMYHYVRDLKNSRFPRIHGLDKELFREQILFFKKHYTFVTIEQVINHFNGGGVLTASFSVSYVR